MSKYKVFPLGEVMKMPKGKNILPDDKQRSETPLAKVVGLAPLVSVILEALELLLKLLRVI